MRLNQARGGPVASISGVDRDIQIRDVTALKDADSAAAFFAQLGYDTSARLRQTAAVLGIPGEPQRKVRRIERLADNEMGALQVYLFELDSVTVQVTQALARALRDRAPSFLLVLTDDYERLDFVLLEREVPITASDRFTQPRVTVRPRVLTINRRNPDVVQMRVLRRFLCLSMRYGPL